MADREGILGRGILSGRGPLRRRMLSSGNKGVAGAGEEIATDHLEELENSVNNLFSSFDQAINKSSCGLCRELVTKIKLLSLEDQKRAIPELRQFMALAESAEGEKEIKDALKRMPTLMKVMEG
ncbi:hypothetical protein KAR91_07560 [Candidatus Pacearchaeota archaeon]|nr:hypothetical protein [Candidatus Pacearchaeota archaeon]